MSCRILTANYKRKGGIQYWVVYCPYCKLSHWLAIGPYTVNPIEATKVFAMPCGSTIEIKPDTASLKRLKRLGMTFS